MMCFGTLAKRGEKEGLCVTILSGDRDTFQLTSDKITVRIPRTKMGKTEVEDFDRQKVLEIYGVEPTGMIEVKGLMGDTSDNIPGVPGVGEKTALGLIQEHGTIDAIYQKLEEDPTCIKGKLKEKLLENKELAYLSKTLGTINLEVPIEESIQDFERQEWNKEDVLATFQELRFNRFIDRFQLRSENGQALAQQEEAFIRKKIETASQRKELQEKIQTQKEMTYYLAKEKDGELVENRIAKRPISLHIWEPKENIVYQEKIQTNKDLAEWK